MNDKLVWGLDIGGTKCAMVIGNENGECLSRRAVATADFPDWEGVLNALLPPESGLRPLAVGVSCGGPLDSRKGIILSPPNLPGWDEVPVTRWLSGKLGVPAFLQNDANACALAEWKFGAGRGCENMVFLTFGTGFGGGLILNGRLYSGTNDMAGEIGHIRAAEDGPTGYRKKGSYEGFCSGGGLRQLSLMRTGREMAAKELCNAADNGDNAAMEVLKESARYLGRAAALLTDLLNPQRIVIGSIFARAERYFRPEMERVMNEESLIYPMRVCSVVPAELGDTIGDMAAITVAWNGLAEQGR